MFHAQVDILDLEPRINPASGKTYGTNAAASWCAALQAGSCSAQDLGSILAAQVSAVAGMIS